MPMKFVPPPPHVLSTYQQSLLDFMGPHAPAVQTYHLPVGTLGLAELAAGATLHDVVPSGCRFLASWADATWTSSEMTDPTLYGNAQFRNFTTGESVAVAFARIAQAQGLDAMQSQDYELHFLSVPGIYLEALHLVSQGTGSDLVLPLLSIDPQLGPDAVCDEATFLAVARASAAVRVKMTSTDPLSS
ncbi:MAG TPA: hypothetical protein VNY05_46400 [Candidatus Acidoferrales bacterium]|jgi:hypothetical protein|nr:hypothetical protein [Candidatus Acidoferrales bacterium]